MATLAVGSLKDTPCVAGTSTCYCAKENSFDAKGTEGELNLIIKKKRCTGKTISGGRVNPYRTTFQSIHRFHTQGFQRKEHLRIEADAISCVGNLSTECCVITDSHTRLMQTIMRMCTHNVVCTSNPMDDGSVGVFENKAANTLPGSWGKGGCLDPPPPGGKFLYQTSTPFFLLAASA